MNITGYSVKAGANYNLTEHDNLFANVGYNSKVPFFQFVFTNSRPQVQRHAQRRHQLA